jgi:hypothetical protein
MFSGYRPQLIHERVGRAQIIPSTTGSALPNQHRRHELAAVRPQTVALKRHKMSRRKRERIYALAFHLHTSLGDKYFISPKALALQPACHLATSLHRAQIIARATERQDKSALACQFGGDSGGQLLANAGDYRCLRAKGAQQACWMVAGAVRRERQIVQTHNMSLLLKGRSNVCQC